MANYTYTVSDNLLTSDSVSLASPITASESITNSTNSGVGLDSSSITVVENYIVSEYSGQNIDALKKTVVENYLIEESKTVRNSNMVSTAQLFFPTIATNSTFSSVRSSTDTIKLFENIPLRIVDANKRTSDTISFNAQPTQSAVVNILSPLDNTIFKRGEDIYFSAKLEFDELVMTGIRWESNIDGVFNYGKKDFYYAGLSIGSHVIRVRGAEGCMDVKMGLTIVDDFAPERAENLSPNG